MSHYGIFYHTTTGTNSFQCGECAIGPTTTTVRISNIEEPSGTEIYLSVKVQAVNDFYSGKLIKLTSQPIKILKANCKHKSNNSWQECISWYKQDGVFIPCQLNKL